MLIFVQLTKIVMIYKGLSLKSIHLVAISLFPLLSLSFWKCPRSYRCQVDFKLASETKTWVVKRLKWNFSIL